LQGYSLKIKSKKNCMAIQNENDLVVNQVYFIALSKNQKAFKIKYLGCVKSKHKPNLYFNKKKEKDLRILFLILE
jgi:hypothetical protein